MACHRSGGCRHWIVDYRPRPSRGNLPATLSIRNVPTHPQVSQPPRRFCTQPYSLNYRQYSQLNGLVCGSRPRCNGTVLIVVHHMGAASSAIPVGGWTEDIPFLSRSTCKRPWTGSTCSQRREQCRMLSNHAASSGALPPSPPAENATARKHQAGQCRTSTGAGKLG
jgi:hypothetical protein